jgi:hypothetical protein
MTMLTDWNYKDVQDFEKLKALWNNENDDIALMETRSSAFGDALAIRLGLPILDMDAEQSKFFKHHYRAGYKDPGIMARE